MYKKIECEVSANEPGHTVVTKTVKWTLQLCVAFFVLLDSVGPFWESTWHKPTLLDLYYQQHSLPLIFVVLHLIYIFA